MDKYYTIYKKLKIPVDFEIQLITQLGKYYQSVIDLKIELNRFHVTKYLKIRHPLRLPNQQLPTIRHLDFL